MPKRGWGAEINGKGGGAVAKRNGGNWRGEGEALSWP